MNFILIEHVLPTKYRTCVVPKRQPGSSISIQDDFGFVLLRIILASDRPMLMRNNNGPFVKSRNITLYIELMNLVSKPT